MVTKEKTKQVYSPHTSWQQNHRVSSYLVAGNKKLSFYERKQKGVIFQGHLIDSDRTRLRNSSNFLEF